MPINTYPRLVPLEAGRWAEQDLKNAINKVKNESYSVGNGLIFLGKPLKKKSKLAVV